VANVARLPHHQDADAEAAVLSAILLSPSLLDELRDVVEPNDFFAIQHRVLFEALLELDEARSPIDTVTVKAKLEALGKWQQVGGAAFISQVMDATPAVANVLDHARLIRRLALLRRMTATLRDLAARAAAPETRSDVEAFMHRCESEVFTASATSTERETARSMRQIMTTAIAACDPRKPRERRGVTTGLADLDQLTMGLSPGELVIVAGRPGLGKTSLALGMAVAVAKTSRHAVVFSMEMGPDELGERSLACEAVVPYRGLLTGDLTDVQWSSVMDAGQTLGMLPLQVDDMTRLTPSRLRSRLRRHGTMLRKAHGGGRLALVVVDYVQLMAWEEDLRNRQDELEKISRQLKIIAKEFGVTMLVLSQLSRPPKGVARIPEPTLSDLRGSGALEQDADKVIFIHRDEAPGEERGEAQLILAKGRNAGTGRVNVTWKPWCVRFGDVETRRFNFDARTGERPDEDFGPTSYAD
jgi:replicative DNA helicase